jgi:hypothetical protein
MTVQFSGNPAETGYRTLSYIRAPARAHRRLSDERRYHDAMTAEELIDALTDLLAQIEDMGDPRTGRLSAGERERLGAQLDALWRQRGDVPLDELGVALFERARRIVDGALDS